MGRRKLYKSSEKKYPGTNFILFIPIRFDGSISARIDKEFKNYCKKKKVTKTDMCRKFLFNFYKVKDEYELMSKYKDIRFAFQTKAKQALLNELDINKSFSEWLESEMKKEMNIK